MFKIYADDKCIHDDTTPLIDFKVFDADLQLSDNAAGSLTFSIPQTHAFYGIDPSTGEPYIRRMVTNITVYKNNDIYWEGRILNETYDFYNTRKVYCEGCLSFLNDTCQPQIKYSQVTASSVFSQIISNHNHKSLESHQFSVTYGAIIQFTDIYLDEWVTQYESTYDAIKKLVDEFGGHLRVRHVKVTMASETKDVRVIDWLKDYPDTSAQTIEFGTNLLEFSKTYDMSSLCTVVLPVGKKIASKGEDMPGDEMSPSRTAYAVIKNSDQPGSSVSLSNYISGSGVYKSTGAYTYASSGCGATHCTKELTLSNIGVSAGDILYYTATQTPVTIDEKKVALAMWIFKDKSGKYIATNLKMGSAYGQVSVNSTKITVPSGAKTMIVGWDSGSNVSLKKNTPANHESQDSTSKHILKEYAVTAESSYYYTGTQDDSNLMYAFKDSNGVFFSSPRKFAAASGKTSLESSKITAPSGAATLVVGALANTKTFSVKACSTQNADYDLYVTVENADTNSDHSIYVKNDFKDDSDPNAKSALDTYGWIEKKMEWPDDDSANTLYEHAIDYLTNGQFDKLSIELTAVDLQLLGINADSLNVLDNVRVVSPPHGIDKIMPITSISVPLDKPETTKYTIGYEEDKSLSTTMAESNANIMVAVDSRTNNTKVLDEAKQQAAALIGGATSGYVTMVPDATTGACKEIVITHDTPNYTESQDLWRWTSTGLGHFTGANAYDQPWNSKVGVAITYDGKIVADNVNAAEIIADCIRGGTLTVGGLNNVNGIIQIKDADGNVIGQFDRSGITNIQRTSGGGSLWALIKDGMFMFGRDTTPSKTTYRGVVNGRIEATLDGDLYTGVSIEAKGTSTDNAVISLCTDRLVLATSNNPNSVSSTIVTTDSQGNFQSSVYDIDIVTNVFFDSSGGGDPVLKKHVETFRFRLGMLMSVSNGRDITVT